MTSKNTSRLPGDTEASLERARAFHQDRAEKQAAGPSIEEAAASQAKEQRQIQGNSVVLDAWNKAKTEVPMMPPSVPVQEGKPKLNEAFREFTLERTDNRPLRFQGFLIGWNETDPIEHPRGTQVQIFVTKSKKIITAVFQWQRSETSERNRRKAAVHTSPEEALEWLIKDGRGKLGRSSKEAWGMACETEVSLRGYDVEVID